MNRCVVKMQFYCYKDDNEECEGFEADLEHKEMCAHEHHYLGNCFCLSQKMNLLALENKEWE